MRWSRRLLCTLSFTSGRPRKPGLRYSACFAIWIDLLNSAGAIQRQPAVRHAVIAQTLKRRQAQLKRVIAKDIGHRFIKALLLPLEEIVPKG